MLGLGAAGAGLLLFAGGGPLAASAANRGPALSDVLTQGSGFAGVSETKHADGSVTDTFAEVSGARVTVSGRTGMRVDIQPVTAASTPHGPVYTRVFGAGPPPVTSKISAERSAAAYLASGRSVVQDAVNIGFDRATAQRLFGHLMVRDDRSQVAELPGAAPVLATSSIYDSWCTNYAQSPDGKVTSSACDVEYLDQANGGDWYMVDKIQASGHSTDSSWYHERLTALGEWVTNAVGNQVVSWKPASTQSVGSCTNITLTLTGQSGASYSETNTICRNSLSPYKLSTSTSSPSAGGVWQGQECTILGSGGQGEWEASESEDMQHSPPTAAWSAYLHVTESWDSTFC